MKGNHYLKYLVLLFALLQVSCESVGGFAARQALMLMRAPNYFEDPVQVELARAVARGDEARILQAIEDGADVNKEGAEGMRPLIWAISKRSLDGFRILLEQGASPDVAANRPNRTPLAVTSLATMLKDTRYLKMALEHGADPDAIPEEANWAPLHYAIYVSHFESVKILVESGADLRLEPAPTALARLGREYEMIYYLLQQGADPAQPYRSRYTRPSSLIERLETDRHRGIAVMHDPRSEEFSWYMRVVDYLIDEGYLDADWNRYLNDEIREEAEALKAEGYYEL
ncbi:MAG: hypothetical protein JJU20_07385 [Opitutales bacterium]|nr:hypothetical protein [Opitutales bacterium]